MLKNCFQPKQRHRLFHEFVIFCLQTLLNFSTLAIDFDMQIDSSGSELKSGKHRLACNWLSDEAHSREGESKG